MARLTGRDRNGENDVADEQPESSRRNPADHLAPYQFKPGHSGNPNGRKKGSITFVSELRKALQEKPNGQGKTRMRLILDAMIAKAQEGDIQHCRELIDRIDGKLIATTLGGEEQGGSVSVDQMLITIQRVRAKLSADSNDHAES